MISGFLIINKPAGWTSFDVVAKLRKITGIKKIGHCGTLDPLATGVLIVAIGREATREIDRFHNLNKTYLASAEFGKISDTYDSEGMIENSIDADFLPPSLELLNSECKKFIGEIEQYPPKFSAKKIEGVAAYKLARQGKIVELKSATVVIKEIDIIEYSYPRLQFRVKCGSGTYIRSLIHDLGQAIGCGAIMTGLAREAIGNATLDIASNIEDITPESWVSLLKQIDFFHLTS